MSAFWGTLSGIVTIVLMLVFIGIWFWAWRPRHRRDFDRLARMPLEDSRKKENAGPQVDSGRHDKEHTA